MLGKVLAALVTSPKHRRKGAASQLINAGLALADAHHLPTYVEATPGGLSIYLKHGFVKVDTMIVDLNPWGKAIVEEHTILVRPAAPAPEPSSISISPFLTNADFLDFAEIEAEAFRMAPILKLLLPRPAEPATKSDDAEKERMRFRAASLIELSITDPSAQFSKAFLPQTHQTIGWAKWNFYVDAANPPKKGPLDCPPGSNFALAKRWMDGIYEPRESYMRGKAYFYMNILAVLPEHQRKGLGTRLLERGLEQADELEVECWIDASPAGLGLYKKLGWKEVNVATLDLEPYGGEPGQKNVDVQLVRLPRPKRAFRTGGLE